MTLRLSAPVQRGAARAQARDMSRSGFCGFLNQLVQTADLGAVFSKHDIALKRVRAEDDGGESLLLLLQVGLQIDQFQSLSLARAAQGWWESAMHSS